MSDRPLCAKLAQQVAARMKLPSKEIDDIRVATLLHDMESIEVTAKVIQKAIGSVAQGNAKQHTFHGSDLAQSLGSVLRGALPLLAARHRDYDASPEYGAVYAPVDEPIGSRVICTVRAYAKLVTEHSEPPSPREAVMILRNDLDQAHHRAVLHALEQVVLSDSEPARRTRTPGSRGRSDRLTRGGRSGCNVCSTFSSSRHPAC